jgi:hypothetical protein
MLRGIFAQLGEAKFEEAVEKLGLDEAFLKKMVTFSRGLL